MLFTITLAKCTYFLFDIIDNDIMYSYSFLQVQLWTENCSLYKNKLLHVGARRNLVVDL